MRCSTGAGRLAVLVWACPFAGTASSSVSIDHAQVGCVVASGYPQFEARFDPSAEVARARLYFRASNTPNRYYVEMAPQAAAWRGTILKPRPEPERIDYYIEVTDRSFPSVSRARRSTLRGWRARRPSADPTTCWPRFSRERTWS